MARTKDYSKKAIIQAAIRLIEEQGHANFSVRNVAKHMGASTQPVYSYFKDKKQLYRATLLAIEKKLLLQINHPYTEFPFRNMGFGFTLFAKENPNLFAAYFHDIGMNKKFIKKFLKKLRELLDNDPRFQKMSAVGKDVLLDKMWTFSYGYSYLIIKGLVEDDSEKAIRKMILDTGTAVIVHALQEEGLLPESK